MSTKTHDQRYHLDPHARFRVMDDEGVFVIQDAGEVLVVNRVGAFIVEQLRGGRGLDEVVASVAERYAVGIEQARIDAASLLDELVQAGAIARS